MVKNDIMKDRYAVERSCNRLAQGLQLCVKNEEEKSNDENIRVYYMSNVSVEGLEDGNGWHMGKGMMKTDDKIGEVHKAECVCIRDALPFNLKSHKSNPISCFTTKHHVISVILILS